MYVATFALSAYACTYSRAGSKPFNPVLGETYECDRPDKGFRFIAEQVQLLLVTTHWIQSYGIVQILDNTVVRVLLAACLL